MIDYKKLKVAHELFKKIFKPRNSLWIRHEDDIDGKLMTFYEFYNGDENEYFFNLDDLIAKLKSLVKPEPKYKVGDEVFVLHGHEIHSFKIHEIIEDGEYWYIHYTDGGAYCHDSRDFDQYTEDILFPSRQALIEHQIEYWCSQMNIKQQIEFWENRYNGGLAFSQADAQSNQSQVDANTCQHDWHINADGFSYCSECNAKKKRLST